MWECKYLLDLIGFHSYLWRDNYCLRNDYDNKMKLSIILLGDLSLHLNHLIAYWLANYNWPFGTLPFGLFGSNLDTKVLETYPRTYSGHFWIMSLFGNSRAIWVLFRKWVVSENQSFLDEGTIVLVLIGLVLGGEVPRLNHGPICCPIQST